MAGGEILGAAGDEPQMTRDKSGFHPAYFTTRFRWEADEPGSWPHQFVIISAHATTGERWTAEENQNAHEALYDQLSDRNLWIDFVTGYEPVTGHAEPSYAVVLPLEETRELGKSFRQDAIFYVRGDELFVTRCDAAAPLVLVGSFRERLDVVRESFDQSCDESSPWARLSAEQFISSLESRMLDDSAPTQDGGRGFVPRLPFTLRAPILDATLTDDDRVALGLELDSGYFPMEEVMLHLPWLARVRPIIDCSTTDSANWGLSEFTAGGRGYVYYSQDPEGLVDTTDRILASWEPSDSWEARRACVVSCYGRVWNELFLPPRPWITGQDRPWLTGQIVRGDPELLLECMLRALDAPVEIHASWNAIVTEWLHSRAHGGLEAVSKHFGLSLACLNRAARAVEAGDLLSLADNAESTLTDRRALAAIYLSCVTEFAGPDSAEGQ